MKISYRIMLMFLIFVSCKNNYESCAVDSRVKREFENCIMIVRARAQGKAISFKVISDAYSCLYSLTKVKSNVRAEDDMPYFYPGRNAEVLLNEDLLAWYEWYFNNECTLTQRYVDSVFSEKKGVIRKWPPRYDGLPQESLTY